MPSVARTGAIAKTEARKIGAKFTTGNVFYVSSTSATKSDSAGSGLAPETPFATLDYAIGRCTASNGDVIYLMPGHAETIASAGAIALDVAGVSVIGLGNGANRPTFTWSTTGSTFTISAASCSVENIRCTSSVDELVSMFVVSAAGVTLDTVNVFETTSAQIIQFLLTTAAADQLTIRNCRHRQTTAAGSAQLWIELVGTDDTVIENNDFYLTLFNGATTATINGSTAVVRCLIKNNTFVQLGGTTQVSAVLLAANSTGFVCDNRAGVGFTSQAATFALANCYGAENYTTNAVNKNGILDPAADS